MPFEEEQEQEISTGPGNRAAEYTDCIPEKG